MSRRSRLEPSKTKAYATRQGGFALHGAEALLAPNRKQRRAARSARALDLPQRLQALLDEAPADQHVAIRARAAELLKGGR